MPDATVAARSPWTVLALLLSISGASLAHAAPSEALAASDASAQANPMLCDQRPTYPPAAARRGIQGTSTMDLDFAQDGTLVVARLAAPSGPQPENALLDQAALASMQHCHLAHGEPRPTTRRLAYLWKLDDGRTGMDAIQALEQAEQERLAMQAADDARLVVEAEKGVAGAQLALARQYADGDHRERDDKLAVKWFRRAAEAGNADAQVYYGQRLMAGKGVSQDDDAGIAWLRKAAAQGSGAAAYGLGIFTRAGRGVRASAEDAFRWFLQGAEAGNRAAILETAEAYAKGAGTPRDPVQATRWFMAATPSSNYAIYRVGLAWRDGLGVPVDYERAAFCMAVLSRHGDRGPTAALAGIASHLDAATLARIQARADAWKVGDPLFP